MNILDALLPASCLCCAGDIRGAGLRIDMPLCGECVQKINWLPDLEIGVDGDVDALFALSDFNGPVRHLIHAFKYAGKERIGEYLARRWVHRTPFDPAEVNFVVPVPMSHWKEFNRGYNPAALLAVTIANQWGKPLLRSGLKRRWISRSQTTLRRGERFENAARSFKMARICGAFRGKSVLLVDDVCTTGATLGACARLLKRAGAVRVLAATASREQMLE